MSTLCTTCEANNIIITFLSIVTNIVTKIVTEIVTKIVTGIVLFFCIVLYSVDTA